MSAPLSRRGFIAGLGSGGLALGFAPLGRALASGADVPAIRLFQDHRRLQLASGLELAIVEHGRRAALLGGGWPLRWLQPPRAADELDWQRQYRSAQLDRRGRLWLLDAGLRRIERFDVRGRHLDTLHLPSELDAAADLVLSAEGGALLSDAAKARIWRLDDAGRALSSWGRLGLEAGQLNGPSELLLDARGLLHVLNRGNRRIDLFSVSGDFRGHYAALNGELRGLGGAADGRHWLLDVSARQLLQFGARGVPLARQALPGVPELGMTALQRVSFSAARGVYLSA